MGLRTSSQFRFARHLLAALTTFFIVASLRAEERSTRIPPREPPEALKTFRLQAGFEIELVAAEPLIRDPVAIAFDEWGRMYVVEYPEFNEYSFKGKPKRSGAVKLLEDGNHDGRFDKSTLFLSEVAFPTAVACYDGGVFVGAAPDLLYCKDTDGDGRADVRERVLTGFARDFAGGGLLNSFHWGLDNQIHIATSFAGGELRRADRPEDEAVSIRSRGVLLDPRTREFDLTSGGGQHGMGVNSWGRKFLCSNVNPIQLLMYDGRYVARNRFFSPPAASLDINGEGRLAELHRVSPLEPWRVERSRAVAASRPEDEGARPGGLFTSASGVTIYRGDAWPAAYRGNLFVGEVANNLVYRAKLEADGVGFVARRADRGAEFLASTDVWFRPVQFANAPDGNLYVVDMYRELIEGAAFVPNRVLDSLDASSGTNRGRIYRIVSKPAFRSKERQTRPSLLPGKMPRKDLVALLEHSNGWHRDTAARLLFERRETRAVTSLGRLAADSKAPLGRLHAMYALDGFGQLTANEVMSRLGDADPRVRSHAIKLSEPIAKENSEIRDKLYSMVKDVELPVRYQLAFSLGACRPSVRRSEALAQLLISDGDERWMQTAVQSSLAQGAGDLLLLLAGNPKFRSSDHGRAFMQSLARQIGAGNRNSELALLLKSLELITDAETGAHQAIVRGLFSGANETIRQQLRNTETGDLKAVLSRLDRDARRIAASREAKEEERVDAVLTLANSDFGDKSLRRLFAELLQLGQSLSVQSAALRTLATFDDPEVPRLLLARWRSFSPALRTQAMETMFARTDWTIAVLEAIDKKTISRADVSKTRLTILQGHRDPRVKRISRQLLESATDDRRNVVEAYQAALRLDGDVDRGKQVFKKSCSVCHRRDALGNRVGADLVGINRRSAETILDNILDPNREFKPKFASYVLVTTDGRRITGMIVAETANSIRLARPDGTVADVLRIHVENLRHTGLSFMPEGLEKQIDVPEMADLLAFLTSLHAAKD